MCLHLSTVNLTKVLFVAIYKLPAQKSYLILSVYIISTDVSRIQLFYKSKTRDLKASSKSSKHFVVDSKFLGYERLKCFYGLIILLQYHKEIINLTQSTIFEFPSIRKSSNDGHSLSQSLLFTCLDAHFLSQARKYLAVLNVRHSSFFSFLFFPSFPFLFVFFNTLHYTQCTTQYEKKDKAFSIYIQTLYKKLQTGLHPDLWTIKSLSSSTGHLSLYIALSIRQNRRDLPLAYSVCLDDFFFVCFFVLYL